MLSFNISKEILTKLQELSKSISKTYQEAQTLEENELSYIRKNVFISNLGASTRIENAVLTNSEIEWVDTTLTEDSKTTAFESKKELIKNKLSKDKERSIEEVVGCRSMLNLILKEGKDFYPLTEVTIRGLHKELLRFYSKAISYSGAYKKKTNSVVRISGSKKYPVLSTAMPGEETQEAMKELIAWYNGTILTSAWTIAVATEFVFRFLAIHPFQDGNGRLGRALFHLVLLQSPNPTLSFLLPYLPLDRHIEKERESYYSVLRRCSEGKFLLDSTRYTYAPFLNFMTEVIISSLQDFQFYRKRYNDFIKLSESAYTVLKCFKEYPEKKLQIRSIIAETNLPRRTINDSLNKLQEKKFIQRYGQGASTRYQLIF